MGFSTRSLTKILLGVGLGILTVSCLTVTIVFGRRVNKTSKLEKYQYILNFDSSSSAIDSSIAIAVLGCISAAAALTAIVLSIFIEKQSLI